MTCRLQVVDGVIQEIASDSAAFLSGWNENVQQVRRLLQEAAEQKAELLAQQKALAELVAAETALLLEVIFCRKIVI